MLSFHCQGKKIQWLDFSCGQIQSWLLESLRNFNHLCCFGSKNGTSCPEYLNIIPIALNSFCDTIWSKHFMIWHITWHHGYRIAWVQRAVDLLQDKPIQFFFYLNADKMRKRVHIIRFIKGELRDYCTSSMTLSFIFHSVEQKRW